MGFVVGAVLLVVLGLGAIAMVMSLGGAIAESKEWRAYFGFFVIAAVIALMGFCASFVAPESSHWFYLAARWTAVGAGMVVCLKVIVVLLRKMFQG